MSPPRPAQSRLARPGPSSPPRGAPRPVQSSPPHAREPARGARGPRARAAGSLERRLVELGYRLPPTMPPLARYRWATRDGDHLHLAGHGPFYRGRPRYVGTVGVDLSVEEGYEANRFVALTMLRTLKNELGTLDLVDRPLTQTSYVKVGPGLGDAYVTVGDGSSDLWVQLFGEEAGLCARMTVGVSELPWAVPTAIVSTWRVRSRRPGAGG